MKYLKFALCNMLFPIMLLLTYWLHITFFKVNVVFYSAIVDGILAAFITILLVSLSKWLNVFSVFEKDCVRSHS